MTLPNVGGPHQISRRPYFKIRFPEEEGILSPDCLWAHSCYINSCWNVQPARLPCRLQTVQPHNLRSQFLKIIPVSLSSSSPLPTPSLYIYILLILFLWRTLTNTACPKHQQCPPRKPLSGLAQSHVDPLFLASTVKGQDRSPLCTKVL